MTTIHTLPVASVVRAGSRHCDVIALGEHTAHLRVIARPEHVLEEKREVIKETTFRNKLISYEEEGWLKNFLLCTCAKSKLDPLSHRYT